VELMAKIKDFLIDLLEQHDSGMTISQIADNTGLPQDVVFDILQRYSRMEPEPSTTLQ
jgi:DNA-binding IclR family transcriptional regulator